MMSAPAAKEREKKNIPRALHRFWPCVLLPPVKQMKERSEERKEWILPLNAPRPRKPPCYCVVLVFHHCFSSIDHRRAPPGLKKAKSSIHRREEEATRRNATRPVETTKERGGRSGWLLLLSRRTHNLPVWSC